MSPTFGGGRAAAQEQESDVTAMQTVAEGASRAEGTDQVEEAQASFGRQVRTLRLERHLTAAALAQRCDVSRSLISQIETGRISPSLDVVRRLAAALDVPIAALFASSAAPSLATASANGHGGNGGRGGRSGAAAVSGMPLPAGGSLASVSGHASEVLATPRVALIRRDERKGLRMPKSKITYELLSPDLRGHLQVQWVELAPGETAPVDGFVHPGEECYVLLRGKIRFRVGDQEFIIYAGDALTFDSALPHGPTNDGPEPAIAISAMTPPSF